MWLYGTKFWWLGEPEGVIKRKRDPDGQFNELLKFDRRLTKEEIEKYELEDLNGEDVSRWWKGNWD